MRTLIRALLTAVLMIVVGISFISTTSEGLDSTKVFLSWEEEGKHLQELVFVMDSKLDLIPASQVGIGFNHLDWQDYQQDYQLTRMELSLRWEDIILESPKADGSGFQYAFGSIGGGVSLSWDNGTPLNIPKAFMVPRQGIFTCIRTQTQVEGEGFVEVKNYYLGDCKGMEVKGRVQVKSFYFHLYGLTFSAPDLLSISIQAKLQILDPISTSSTLSWMFGIELDEALHRNLSEETYQRFFSQNWFGEVTLQNQANALTLGLKLDEEDQLHPYIKVAMSLSL